MKNLLMTLLAGSALAALTACASATAVSGANLNGEKLSIDERPLAHIQADNWGIYFFCFPLLTGSTSEPGSIVAFKNTVNVESVVPVVSKRAQALGATKTLDMASQYDEFGLFFYVRNVNVTANAVK